MSDCTEALTSPKTDFVTTVSLDGDVVTIRCKKFNKNCQLSRLYTSFNANTNICMAHNSKLTGAHMDSRPQNMEYVRRAIAEHNKKDKIAFMWSRNRRVSETQLFNNVVAICRNCIVMRAAKLK